MSWKTVCLLGVLAGPGFAGDQFFSSGWSTAAYHGYTIDAAGDVNADGYADLAPEPRSL